MSNAEWKPSPELRTAVSVALHELALTWDFKFRVASESGEDGRILLRSYCSAMRDITDMTAIRQSASAWTDQNNRAPTPYDLASAARAIAAHRRGDLVLGVQPVSLRLPDPPDYNATRIDELGARALEKLGSFALVIRAWTRVHQDAIALGITSECRNGNVPDHLFDAAVDAVLDEEKQKLRELLAAANTPSAAP